MLTTKLTSGSILGTICLDKSMLSLARWGMVYHGMAGFSTEIYQTYRETIGKP